MATQLVTWVCGLVAFIFIPRVLGSAAYGRVYLALSIQLILSSVIDFGGNYLITKDISRNREGASEIMSHAMTLRFILWAFSIVLANVVCLIAHYAPEVTTLVMILAFANVWINTMLLFRYCYLGFEDIKYPSIGAVAERGFMMVSVVIALLIGAHELVVVILIAMSGLLSFAISAKYSGTMFKFRFSIQWNTLKRLTTTGLPYFFWAVFGIIYFRINAVMLSLMALDNVVGWYGAAFRFFDVLMFLPSMFAQALYPIISRLSAREPDSMIRTTRKSLEFLFLTSIPIAVGMIFFAMPIIALLLGLPAFGPSVPVLQLLSFGTVLTYVDFVLGNSVLALDKEKKWAFVGFGAMLVNIGLNLILIKHFQSHYGNGGLGAAIATDLTELFVMICAASKLPKRIYGGGLGAVTAKGVIAGGSMALLIFEGQRIEIPSPLLAPVGIMAYCGLIVIFRPLDRTEIEYITSAVSARNIRRMLAKRRGVDA